MTLAVKGASPAPRSTPAPTPWSPSETWKTAATMNSGTAIAAIAGSFVMRAESWRGIRR